MKNYETIQIDILMFPESDVLTTSDGFEGDGDSLNFPTKNNFVQ